MFKLSTIFANQRMRDYTDDLQILRTWAEYTDDNKTMKYLMYEMVVEEAGGKVTHLYKALKLLRIIRLPKSAKQSEAFMSMHSQILGGVWSQNINFTTLIANILTPKAIGLVFCYGVQGVSATIEQAKKKADLDYASLQGALQGTYRTLQFRTLNYEELEWIREKLFTMNNIVVVRGIPKAKDGGVDAGTEGVGGQSVNPDSEDTTEEFVAGMVDHEYIVQILSTPVKKEHLERWLQRSSQEMTRWNTQLQGSSGISFGLSIPMMYMANLGASQGWSHSYTDASTVSTSVGENFATSYGTSESDSISQSFGEGLSKSIGKSITDSFSQSHSTSLGESHTTGTSETLSESWGTSHSIGESISHGLSQSENSTHSIGNATSDGTSNSETSSHATSHGTSSSESVSDGTSEGTSHSTGTSVGRTHSEGSTDSSGWSKSHSDGTSDTRSFGGSDSRSSSTANSSSHTVTNSDGENHGYNHGDNWSNGGGKADTKTLTESSSESGWWNKVKEKNFGGAFDGLVGGEKVTGSDANGHTDSTNWSDGHSRGWTDGITKSHSDGVSNGTTTSEGETHTQSFSQSNGESHSDSSGTSGSHSTSKSDSTSTTTSETNGTSTSVSHSVAKSQGITDSFSDSVGTSRGTTHSESATTSQGWGTSKGTTDSTSQTSSTSETHSTSKGTSKSESFGTTKGESWGDSRGTSYGQSQSDSYSQSVSNGTSKSWGKSSSISNGKSYSESEGRSLGQAMGITGTTSSGTSSTMGLGPSLSYTKSYQWLDQEVKNILTLLEFQNNRLMKALRGNGAFFTDIYIGTMNDTARAAASMLARTAWNNTESLICPLQVLDLEQGEQAHLLYHFAAFSADNAKENLNGAMESYRYSTILLPDEFTAYTHLPRISEGGVFADVEDIPKFAVPSNLSGEIFIGNILSAERYSAVNGYETPFEYRLSSDELMHGFFTGESRSGKTVAALRFVSEATKIRRKTGKKLRIVALDPKQDWRTLAKLVEPERFHFYSLGNPDFLPINLNICKVPHNVNPQTWIDGIIEIYCRNYGLMERGKSLLAETFYELYKEAGVFEDSPNWRNFVPERSKTVNLCAVYKRLLRHKLDLEDPAKGKGRAGNEMRDAYARIIDRMNPFGRDFSLESRLFGRSDGIGIDDLIGKDDVIVLESYGLETTFKNFVFGCITSGFFKYAQGHQWGFLADDQYETMLVIEEANEVLCGSDTAGGGQQMGLAGQSEFEKILDQAAGLGLFIISITQKIADMPSSVVANSGLVFAGKISRTEDTQVIIRKIGREERIDNRDVLKWFPRSPIGWFVCRSSRNFNFLQVEPSLVHIAPVSVSAPTNDELTALLNKKKALALLTS